MNPVHGIRGVFHHTKILCTDAPPSSVLTCIRWQNCCYCKSQRKVVHREEEEITDCLDREVVPEYSLGWVLPALLSFCKSEKLKPPALLGVGVVASGRCRQGGGEWLDGPVMLG